MDSQNDSIIGLLRKAQEMISYLNQNPDSLAGLKLISAEDKVQYTHTHNSIKRKGGSSPVDYQAVEIKVDLEQSLRRNDLKGIAASYYKLARIIPLH